ncbi:MAG: conjugal transfer protein TraX [Lachnospiraceae bacterium]|nr:conjugal transfer protein TraX [Lachnospiraceae bacterium]
MELKESKLRVLNRDVIKYIAMLVMFLNHFSHIFLESGTLLKEICEDVGYFTAITMCYFLVEGYEYTRSKKKYAIRLLIFAIISQIPFQLAFQFGNLNMLFTLFFCFLILVAMEKIQNKVLQTIVVVLLVFVTVFCDWALMAAIFTILFANYKDSRKKMTISYVFAFILFGAFNTMNYLYVPGLSTAEAILHGAISAVPILVSGFVIMNMYNGKRAEKGRNFSKWFFYAFYPGHLLVLWLIKNFMM